jgi:DNA-binding response OmpR family regulator
VKNRARLRILLVEDNPGDVFLVRRALAKHEIDCDLVTVEDGEAALRYLECPESSQQELGNGPDLILLDLNLPRRSGTQILEELTKNPSCRHAPVIILTSSDSARDRAEVLRLGAAYYFCKPTDLAGFMMLGEVEEVMARSIQGRQAQA